MKLIIGDDITELKSEDFLKSEDLLKRLKKLKAVAVKVQGELIDLNSVSSLPPESEIHPVTPDSAEGLAVCRHSAAHVMAHAVKELFPNAALAIGPAIDDGFYYDIDVDVPFTPEDIDKIEKTMRRISNRNTPFVRKVLTKADAVGIFQSAGEKYKLEILAEIADDTVSVYEEGGFMDLCRGPHVPHTGAIGAFKLLKTAGAYWRGDEKRKMLQRIYGTAFASDDKLKEYLNFLEEVKKRDHRLLGRQLDLFSISEDIGSGLILWHPKGALIRKIIEDFWRNEHLNADYGLLNTPHIANIDLWRQSGHLDFYRDNMYSPMDIDGTDYELKPMNCPFHIAVFNSALRSYRDMPIRYAELGTVYRYERSGVLHGLLRVRGFTQDDAHIFCRLDQIEDEILGVLDFTVFVLKTFGFDNYDVYLSTRPDKFVGTPDNWEISTNALKRALETRGMKYRVDPGEGVFYGPKIDIKVSDTLGRQWQCSTIQVDFNLPERFNVRYRGSDDKEHMPIMIHRALMGSLERFFGILIEHYAGAFPLWLSPVQVSVVTIADRHEPVASGTAGFLKAGGIRVELDIGSEKIGYKIRQSSINKIPYAVIVGDKEAESGAVTVRRRDGENLEFESNAALLAFLKNKSDNRDNTI